MHWITLSNEAKSILEWVEHVHTGEKQILIIELGKTWTQYDKYTGEIKVEVTETLFKEISEYLPFSDKTIHQIKDSVIAVTLKDGVKLH